MAKNKDEETFASILFGFIGRAIVGVLGIFGVGVLLIVINFVYGVVTQSESRLANEQLTPLVTKQQVDQSLSGWKQERVSRDGRAQSLCEKHPGCFKVIYTSLMGATIDVYYTKDEKIIASWDNN